jgi:hypothetical protein
MKRSFLFVGFILVVITLNAQNLQLHYDFGEDRKYFTTTVEMFRPDTFGSTFFFVDMDYAGENNGVSLAYWEIARDLKFWDPPVALHLEYNDGLAIFQGDTLGEIFRQSWFAGVSFPMQFGSLSVSTMFLYKSTKNSSGADFQWTNVWFFPFLKGKLFITGYSDLWTEDEIFGDPLFDEKKWVFQAEPQLWYNFYGSFSVGGEIEISKNFIPGSDQWEFMPTLGIRADF